MKTTIMFTGDVNLRTVTDANTPFARVKEVLKQADLRFGNLECGFFDDHEVHTIPKDGFQASPAVAEALRIAGYDVLGTANNGNYGDEPILLTIKKLHSLGIQHMGSGANSAEAHKPVILDAKGVKVGMLQRTCVYWPMGHEAGEDDPGVAAFQVHTSYRLPIHRAGLHVPPLNRPGIPPEVVCTLDPKYVKRLQEDLEALRSKCDIVVASLHWGFKRDVLPYMTELAHIAIEAGAHAVIGHGPHHPMAIEVYKGCPIYYSLSSFSFNIGHRGQKSGNWLGEMARVTFEGGKAVEAAFRWVRHDDGNRTYFPDPRVETAALEDIQSRSDVYGTKLSIAGDEVRVAL